MPGVQYGLSARQLDLPCLKPSGFSPRPRRDGLYPLISSAITAVFPPAYMVLTFHVAMVQGRLGVRRSFGRRLLAVFHVRRHFLSLAWDAEESSFPRLWDFLVFIYVSVACRILRVGVASPKPNLPPFVVSGVLELVC